MPSGTSNVATHARKNTGERPSGHASWKSATMYHSSAPTYVFII